MKKTAAVIAVAILSACGVGVSGPEVTKVSEKQMSFGDCRNYTQALAGALTGRLGQYTVDTAERLESTITNRDGRLKIEVICLAEENKAIIRETTIGDPATICWHAGCPR